MSVRMLREVDEFAWFTMRAKLWPDGGSDEVDARKWLNRPNAVTLVAEDEAGTLLGFAEAGERAYADGCSSSPVGFLEGWYVEPSARGQGWGAALVQAVAAWAASRHLVELASDALLENDAAIASHLRNGFEEVERSVKFRMSLNRSE